MCFRCISGRGSKCSSDPDMSMDSWPLFAFLRSTPETISTSGLRGQPAPSPHHCVSATEQSRQTTAENYLMSPVLQPMTPKPFLHSSTPHNCHCTSWSCSSCRSGMAFLAVSRWQRNLPWTGLRSSPARIMWPWPGWTAGVGLAADRRPPLWIHASLAHLESKIIWEL